MIKEGIFEKGFCSEGKDWRKIISSTLMDIVQIKTNNFGCLWALNSKNEVDFFF